MLVFIQWGQKFEQKKNGFVDPNKGSTAYLIKVRLEDFNLITLGMSKIG
ncbi:hypothetical protein [Candidatus Lokiarchaeum ossiferum]